MTEVLKAHQHLLLKVSQEKRTDYLVQTSRNEIAKVQIIVGMFQNMQSSKLQVDADSDTRVHTNTKQNLLMKDNSVSIAIHIPANYERQIQQRNTQSDDKTQFRVRFIISQASTF